MLTAAIAVVVIDQLSKALVIGLVAPGHTWMITTVLRVSDAETLALADGRLPALTRWAAASLAMVVITAAYVATRLRSVRPWMRVPAGLLLGGALGNLIDRVLRGGVTDWLIIGHIRNTNLGDIAIAAGVLGLLLQGSRAAFGPGRTSGRQAL